MRRVAYLREYESIFETALAHASVDPWVLFDEKKPEVENFVRLSLHQSSPVPVRVMQSIYCSKLFIFLVKIRQPPVPFTITVINKAKYGSIYNIKYGKKDCK
jgi:hypothetical protein